MHCMKCGRSIPDGSVFCADCAAPAVQPVPAPLPRKTATAPRPVKKKKPAAKPINFRRLTQVFLLWSLVATLLLAAAAVYIRRESDAHARRVEALRVREASVKLREQEADNRDRQIDDLKAQLKDLEGQLKYAEETIAGLQESLQKTSP